MTNLVTYIKLHKALPESSIVSTVQLLNQDNSIPFISRYRKEQTGNLNEVDILEISNLKTAFDVLEKRKRAILKSIDEHEQLTSELKQNIAEVLDLNALEDLYLPFKKKRTTKADWAKSLGLEPLAKQLMAQRALDLKNVASKYTNKDLERVESVLEGVRFIIAEWINERADIRAGLRKQLARHAELKTAVKPKKKLEESSNKYKDYFEWTELLNRIPSHRLLAILRAENEGVLSVKIEHPEEEAIQYIQKSVLSSDGESAHQISLAIKDAYKRLLFPSLTNEVLKQAKLKADQTAIKVFANNLKQLLLGAPLGQKRVLGIDPGFKSGCKLVCLDAFGGLEYNETIYPHPPQNQHQLSAKKISSLTEAYKIDAIAIGNGTASRETERLIRSISFKNDIQLFIVNEAGASVYSASSIARAEFPNYDVTVRGAISIGRRLQDPLAELVKIDPKSIGVGQYQHDVDQNLLKSELDAVVQSSVNSVGVNLNTASTSLLAYISGIGNKLAENIVKHRQINGSFNSRDDLKQVSQLGDKAFEQSAGFLRVKNSKQPLDDSAVHPERYDLVNKMAKDLNTTTENLIGNSVLIKQINTANYITNELGKPTLDDIINELEKPGLDSRDVAKVFAFNKNLKTILDVKSGQLLPGIVNNITNFGAFVDIGIKESGLIHISNLADEFVSDVNQHISLHQHLIVKVLDVDIERKRIQLKLHK